MLNDAIKNASMLLHSPSLTVKTVPVCFEDGAEFCAGSIKLKAVHTPGHTKGSVCYFSDGCVFTGDTVFSDGYGRTDLYGGSFAELKISLKKLNPLLKNKRIYPGHGETRDL